MESSNRSRRRRRRHPTPAAATSIAQWEKNLLKNDRHLHIPLWTFDSILFINFIYAFIPSHLTRPFSLFLSVPSAAGVGASSRFVSFWRSQHFSQSLLISLPRRFSVPEWINARISRADNGARARRRTERQQNKHSYQTMMTSRKTYLYIFRCCNGFNCCRWAGSKRWTRKAFFNFFFLFLQNETIEPMQSCKRGSHPRQTTVDLVNSKDKNKQ